MIAAPTLSIAKSTPCVSEKEIKTTEDLERVKKLVKDPYGTVATETVQLGSLKFSYPCLWKMQDVDDTAILNPDFVGRQYDPFRGAQIDIEVRRTINADLTSEALDLQFTREAGLVDHADTYIPAFELQSKEDATLLGKPARRYRYTGEFQSQKVQGEAVLVSIGTSLYEVKFAALPQYFDFDYSVLKKVTNSLTIVTPDSTARPKSLKTQVTSRKPAPAAKKAEVKETKTTTKKPVRRSTIKAK